MPRDHYRMKSKGDFLKAYIFGADQTVYFKEK